MNKQILHVSIIKHKYFCLQLQPHFVFWREIIKGNLYTSHWTWTWNPNSWSNLFSYDCSLNSSTLTYAWVWFPFSWLNYGYVSDWTVIYRNNIDTTTLKTFPMFTRNIHCFCCRYRNSSVILIHEIKKKNYLETLCATLCLRLWYFFDPRWFYLPSKQNKWWFQ